MDPYAQLYQYYSAFTPSPQPQPPQQPPQLGVQLPQGIHIPPLQPQVGSQIPRPAEGVGPVRYLFVGGFPGETTQEELFPVLEQFGVIELLRITPGKCCCFVRYMDLGSAIAAHDKLHGTQFKGSYFKVGWGKSDIQEDATPPSRVLWIGNIDPMTGEGEIAHLFGVHGQILQVRVLPAKFCAFVTFHELKDAIRARNALNGYAFKGKTLRINFRKVTKNIIIYTYTYFIFYT